MSTFIFFAIEGISIYNIDILLNLNPEALMSGFYFSHGRETFFTSSQTNKDG